MCMKVGLKIRNFQYAVFSAEVDEARTFADV